MAVVEDVVYDDGREVFAGIDEHAYRVAVHVLGRILHMVFGCHKVATETCLEMQILGEIQADKSVPVHTVAFVVYILFIDSLDKVVVKELGIDDGIRAVRFEGSIPRAVLKAMRQHGCADIAIGHTVGVGITEIQ